MHQLRPHRSSAAIPPTRTSATATTVITFLQLELGGKSPAIVFPDADLDAAIELTHFALYFNQGQVSQLCINWLLHAVAKLEQYERMQNLPWF